MAIDDTIVEHLTDLADPVVHIHLGASQTQGGFTAHGDDMFTLSTILASIFKIAALFRIATGKHLLHEPIIVDAIIARMVLLKLIPVISEYLFEDAPSGYTFMIHRK
jgi:hypothetical protein